MKRKTIFSVTLVFLLVGSYFGYNYVYQEHRDISTETAEYTTSAKELISEFLSNTEAAQAKYLNKTIAINGLITAQTNNSITLNNAIFCSLSNTNSISEKQSIKIKGRCIGYDDLLEEIKLDQCTLINTFE